MEQMIALNVGGLTRLTYAAAPAFVARGKGTIVSIASRCYQSRNLERRTEGKSLRPGSLTIVASRTRQQGTACAGRVAGCNVDRILGHSRHAGSRSSNGDSDAGRRNGQCALAGLDLGEFATIPRYPTSPIDDAFEGARQRLMPNPVRCPSCGALPSAVGRSTALAISWGNSGKSFKSSPQPRRAIPTPSLLFKVSRPRFIRPAPNIGAEGSRQF
jgi:hypothetical protein